jgi:hypothetical protein
LRSRPIVWSLFCVLGYKGVTWIWGNNLKKQQQQKKERTQRAEVFILLVIDLMQLPSTIFYHQIEKKTKQKTKTKWSYLLTTWFGPSSGEPRWPWPKIEPNGSCLLVKSDTGTGNRCGTATEDQWSVPLGDRDFLAESGSPDGEFGRSVKFQPRSCSLTGLGFLCRSIFLSIKDWPRLIQEVPAVLL